MATLSKHAEIRFHQLFSQGIDEDYLLRKNKFEENVLYKGLTPSVPERRLFDMDNLKLLISRCLEHQVMIYGIENSMDSELPHFVETKEEYTKDEQNQEWILDALNWLEANGVNDLLFITYQIPDWILEMQS